MGYFFNTTTPSNSAPASSFVLEETTGVTLTLKDRALPYRPISINGRQRAEFTWYPGSPNATVQMLGPEEGVITLRGFWKERFIAGSNNAMVSTVEATTTGSIGTVSATRGGTAAGLGGLAFGGTPIDSVVDLVQQVDTMRRNGKLMILRWGDLIRHGHITSFTQTWHNIHDCEWEIEFSVIAQEAMTTPAVKLPPDVGSIAITAQAFYDQVSKLIENNPVAAAVRNVADDATQLQSLGTQLQSNVRVWSNSVTNVAQQAVSVIQTPNEVGRSLLGAISGPTVAVFQAAGSIVDGALTEWFIVTEPLGVVQQDNVPFGLQISQRSYVTQVKTAIKDIQTSNAIWRSEYTQAMQQGGVRNYVATADTDLRDVATRFYGIPDNWIQLMQYNGLLTSSVPAGYVVLIPPRLDGAPAGRP